MSRCWYLTRLRAFITLAHEAGVERLSDTSAPLVHCFIDAMRTAPTPALCAPFTSGAPLTVS